MNSQSITREGGKAQGWVNTEPVFPHRLHLQLCLLCLSGLPIPNVDFLFLDLLDIPHFCHCPTASSGLHGLGIGALGFDWSSVSSYLGSPLASPWFATANIAAGFALFMYVIYPLAYWLNIYKAKTFPIFSDGLFTSTGQSYNVSAIIDPNFHIDIEAYDRKGPLYISTFFSISYGVNFACLAATVVHVFLFHGRYATHLA